MSDGYTVRLPGLGDIDLVPDKELEELLDSHLGKRLPGKNDVALAINLTWTLCCAAAKVWDTLAGAMRPPRTADEVIEAFSDLSSLAIKATIKQYAGKGRPQ